MTNVIPKICYSLKKCLMPRYPESDAITQSLLSFGSMGDTVQWRPREWALVASPYKEHWNATADGNQLKMWVGAVAIPFSLLSLSAVAMEMWLWQTSSFLAHLSDEVKLQPAACSRQWVSSMVQETQFENNECGESAGRSISRRVLRGLYGSAPPAPGRALCFISFHSA